MIVKEVVITPEFKKDYEKLNNELKEQVKRILKSIEYSEKIKGVYHSIKSGFVRIYFCAL